jgi:hypothetical protein
MRSGSFGRRFEMLEITRELVEHYLRATGWEPSTLGFWTRRSRQVGTFDGMTAFDIDRAIEEIATSDRLTRSALAFRLGLCAAAESLLAEARVVNESIARGGPVVDEYDERVGSMRFVASQMEAADSILALAGIDAATWESARKR